MDCYHISFSYRCTDCKGNDSFRSDLLKKLWKQMQSSASCQIEQFTCDALPLAIFKSCKNFFQLVLPHIVLSNREIPDKNSESLSEENQWFKLTANEDNDLFLEKMLKELNTINWDDLDNSESEIVAERLHNIADLLTINTCSSLNIFWLTCGHAECIEKSDSIPLYGALKRLHTWNNASITLICNTENECEFTDPWFEELDISVVNLQRDENILVDNDVIWQGSLECLEKDENQGNYDWCLSNALCSVQPSKDILSNSNKVHVHEKDVLADNIKIVRELSKSVVPFWKIFPSQFVLYEKSLLKRVFEIQETSSLDFESPSEDTETLLLASIATCDRRHQSKVRTTKDWVDFISSESNTSHNDKVQTKCPVIKTFYLVLYPVEPGIFTAYFLRPEASLIDIHSLLAVYRAIFPSFVKKNTDYQSKNQESVTENTQYEDEQERRWLQLLDAIESSEKSPLKSQLSLAVHLDASEMLKHFTKDGKPLKKDLKSLLKQMQEKQNGSPTGKKEMQKRHELTAGVEYCSDIVSATIFSSSPKLLPKHETLSICNTPKSLARAKLQDVKREATKSLSAPDTTQSEQLASIDTQLDQSGKKLKSRSNKRSSNEERNEETGTSKVERDPVSQEKSRKKRGSFDGNETMKRSATMTSAKEKRSDRHKRRLFRVVKRSLIKYGVDPAEEYFTTCSERLYYLCKSFLKDLKTSEGLNNEMKRLADSNVATVVEFEKRRSKDGEQHTTS